MPRIRYGQYVLMSPIYFTLAINVAQYIYRWKYHITLSSDDIYLIDITGPFKI